MKGDVKKLEAKMADGCRIEGIQRKKTKMTSRQKMIKGFESETAQMEEAGLKHEEIARMIVQEEIAVMKKEIKNKMGSIRTASSAASTAVGSGSCTRTHLLHAHFSAHSAHSHICTFSCVCTHTHVSSVEKVFVAHVSLLSISPSPFSCLTHPLLSP